MHPGICYTQVCQTLTGSWDWESWEAAFEAAESDIHYKHQVIGLPGTAVSVAMALTGDDCCEYWERSNPFKKGKEQQNQAIRAIDGIP